MNNGDVGGNQKKLHALGIGWFGHNDSEGGGVWVALYLPMEGERG